MVSKVDRIFDFQDYHPTTVVYSKKSPATVDLFPKVDCRLEGLLEIHTLSNKSTSIQYKL
jgi:hypothetical protein